MPNPARIRFFRIDIAIISGRLQGYLAARSSDPDKPGSGEAIEGAHRVFANITLALIFAHIAAVILASFAHHENLIRAMITGYKRLPSAPQDA